MGEWVGVGEGGEGGGMCVVRMGSVSTWLGELMRECSCYLLVEIKFRGDGWPFFFQTTTFKTFVE